MEAGNGDISTPLYYRHQPKKLYPAVRNAVQAPHAFLAPYIQHANVGKLVMPFKLLAAVGNQGSCLGWRNTNAGV